MKTNSKCPKFAETAGAAMMNLYTCGFPIYFKWILRIWAREHLIKNDQLHMGRSGVHSKSEWST